MAHSSPALGGGHRRGSSDAAVWLAPAPKTGGKSGAADPKNGADVLTIAAEPGSPTASLAGSLFDEPTNDWCGMQRVLCSTTGGGGGSCTGSGIAAAAAAAAAEAVASASTAVASASEAVRAAFVRHRRQKAVVLDNQWSLVPEG